MAHTSMYLGYALVVLLHIILLHQHAAKADDYEMQGKGAGLSVPKVSNDELKPLPHNEIASEDGAESNTKNEESNREDIEDKNNSSLNNTKDEKKESESSVLASKKNDSAILENEEDKRNMIIKDYLKEPPSESHHYNDARERQKRIFVALYSARTQTVVFTMTETQLSTCVSSAAGACNGRRRRSTFSRIEKDLFESSLNRNSEIDGTLLPAPEALPLGTPKKHVKKQRHVSLISTLYSTITLTTTTYTDGITVSLTVLCSVGSFTTDFCFG